MVHSMCKKFLSPQKMFPQNLLYLVLTITELILDDHVVVLCPGRVVANQMRMRAKYRVGAHFAECRRPVRERRERELMGEGVV